MARLRDLLVHRSREVDPARLPDYARNQLVDIDDYLAAVERHIAAG